MRLTEKQERDPKQNPRHIAWGFALVLALFDSRMRATGTALYLLIFNLVGQSTGPMLIGLLNDGPFAAEGDNAVRYSLLAGPLVICLGAVLLFCLSLVMQRDAGDNV